MDFKKLLDLVGSAEREITQKYPTEIAQKYAKDELRTILANNQLSEAEKIDKIREKFLFENETSQTLNTSQDELTQVVATVAQKSKKNSWVKNKPPHKYIKLCVIIIFALALLFVGYRLADKWWRNSAAYAFKQGEIYWSQKKHATGLKWYLIAVDKGHVAATKKAAECYHYGWAGVKDYVKAIELFHKLVDDGAADSEVLHLLAYSYYSLENYTEAIKWFKTACEKGDTNSLFYVGHCYYWGLGVEKNYTEAVKWYRQAAESGCSTSMCCLGVAYYFGEGVEKNYTEAKKFWQMAAKKGSEQAKAYLKNYFNIGSDEQENKVQDNDDAEDSSANNDSCIERLRKQAEANDAVAQYELAVCYEKGDGVEKNNNEAVKWYRKAAEQGDADAQYELAVCYKNGKGVEKNIDEAVKWLKLAAEQGHKNSQYFLGACYVKEIGVSRNLAEAVKWFKLAAEQGHKSAQYHLGLCYKYGTGVSIDAEEAVKWLKLAADQGVTDAKKALEEIERIKTAIYKN